MLQLIDKTVKVELALSIFCWWKSFLDSVKREPQTRSVRTDKIVQIKVKEKFKQIFKKSQDNEASLGFHRPDRDHSRYCFPGSSNFRSPVSQQVS